MTRLRSFVQLLPLSSVLLAAQSSAPPAAPQHVFGYRDFTQQAKWDAAFIAVPDAKLAGQHLKTLTAAPHWASSPEDYNTAVYVADKFKAAGLETEIVPYRVLLNKPVKILIEAFDAAGNKLMSGPTPEHVDPKLYGGDPFQDDPRILPAFNGSSPSGDVTAEVVYANYGTLADFKKLAELGVSVKGKIVLVRYGGNFRGVKVYIAQQYGAAGVLIYSDPADDGYFRGDVYPNGPYRPDSAVQRGSVQFLPIYPGDPPTPGIASTPDLPDSKRIPADKLQANRPSIPANPLSYKDAAPILEALAGPDVPTRLAGRPPLRLPPRRRPAKVTVHMHLEQDTALRTIWDVIGTIDGTDPAQKDDWVVAGNHRDAWVYGAVDPNSGTAAMLETVHGLGALLKQGWKPKRTHRHRLLGRRRRRPHRLHRMGRAARTADLAHAVAYFNTDVGVSGPNFNASAVPSLKQFVREVTREVPSPKGGTVYDQWLKDQAERATAARDAAPDAAAAATTPAPTAKSASATSAPAPTTPPSSSTSASPPPTSAPTAPTASTTPSSTTTTGSSERRPHLRLRAAAGPRLRPRNPPHGRRRRPPLRLRRSTATRSSATSKPPQQPRHRRQPHRSTSPPPAPPPSRFAAAGAAIHARQLNPARRRRQPSTTPCATPKPPCSTPPASPAAPGSNTPSTPPASSPATPPSSSPASTRPSTPPTPPAPRPSSPPSPTPSTAPPPSSKPPAKVSSRRYQPPSTVARPPPAWLHFV